MATLKRRQRAASILLLGCSLALCVPATPTSPAASAAPAAPGKLAATARAPAKPRAAPRRAAGKAVVAAATYAQRPDAMQAADDIAVRRGLDPLQVRRTIGQARMLPQIARWVLPPSHASAKNWDAYRSRFVEPVRIRAGMAFWDANAALLARAQREFGVPPEIVVGVLGVETLYGRDTGSFRVIDALATLSFDFPAEHPRARERRAF